MLAYVSREEGEQDCAGQRGRTGGWDAHSKTCSRFEKQSWWEADTFTNTALRLFGAAGKFREGEGVIAYRRWCVTHSDSSQVMVYCRLGEFTDYGRLQMVGGYRWQNRDYNRKGQIPITQTRGSGCVGGNEKERADTVCQRNKEKKISIDNQ